MSQGKRERKAANNRKDIHKDFHIFGMPVSHANVFRAVGLLVFLLFMIVATVALWPVIASFFSEAGRQHLVSEVKGAGPVGVFLLLALEFIQVVVAFIPGEVVQMVAGMLYGPWLGALIILLGCFLSTWTVYELVHRLGHPFVEAMVPTKYLDGIRRFEESGKLSAAVFILFLIPGLPKDTFTYLVPLTMMPRHRYLAISVCARIPGVLMSTFAASGLMTGNHTQSVIIFVVLGVFGVIGFFLKDKITEKRHKAD